MKNSAPNNDQAWQLAAREYRTQLDSNYDVELTTQEIIAINQTAEHINDNCAPHELSLLSILACSQKFGLEFLPLFKSLAEEHSSRFRKKEQAIEELIGQSKAPLEAIESVSGVLPTSVTVGLSLTNPSNPESAENNKLSYLYSRLLNRSPEAHKVTLGDDGSHFPRFMRLVGRAFFAFCVITFFLMKIVPEFQMMFEEFGIELPRIFINFMSISSTIVKLWFIPFLIFLLLIPLFFVPSFRRYIKTWSPLTWKRRYFSNSASHKRDLALITESGNTLKSGLVALLKNNRKKRKYNRLKSVEARIDQGQPQLESLVQTKVLSSSEAESIGQSKTLEVQGWLLRWAADNQQIKAEKRENFWLHFLISLGNILIAGFVALVAISLFSVMAKLIGGISG